MYSAGDLLVSVAPIGLLLFLMTWRGGMPSSRALPLIAAIAYLIALVWLELAPALVHATVLDGLLSALTPILIVWGAILLFKTMEVSGAMDTIRRWLDGVTSNRVAQLMIVGWAFEFLIEGASGFGTPAALAAPLLVGMGFPPLPVAVLCLAMNSVPVSFGAVGTPVWFGLGELALSAEQLGGIGVRAAIIHGAAAFVIVPVALRFVVPTSEIRAAWRFVLLSILACVAPYVAIACFDREFPAIAGGLIGLGATVWLARRNVGLPRAPGSAPAGERPRATQVAAALFPIWGAVLVLAVTRVPQLGLRDLLQRATPALTLRLGTLGDLSVSPALVLQLERIFGTEIGWSFRTLYVPGIVPFFVVALATALLYRMPWSDLRRVWTESAARMTRPVLALLGALVFVKLLMAGGERAAVRTIGLALAEVTGTGWIYVASLLGALGAFFSGSNTISNLTFGPIQLSIARDIGLDVDSVLALQTVGGAMGSMACIHNIVAVCAVLALPQKEGAMLARTALPLAAYAAVTLVAAAALVMLG